MCKIFNSVQGAWKLGTFPTNITQYQPVDPYNDPKARCYPAEGQQKTRDQHER